MGKTCEECRHAYFQDEGYSNYTVENTAFTCMKGKHPDGTFDRFYGNEEKLNFAEKCDGFEGGDPIFIDVDQEEIASLTPEQKALWDAYHQNS